MEVKQQQNDNANNETGVVGLAFTRHGVSLATGVPVFLARGVIDAQGPHGAFQSDLQRRRW
jgi:hypothetical protein